LPEKVAVVAVVFICHTVSHRDTAGRDIREGNCDVVMGDQSSGHVRPTDGWRYSRAPRCRLPCWSRGCGCGRRRNSRAEGSLFVDGSTIRGATVPHLSVVPEIGDIWVLPAPPIVDVNVDRREAGRRL